MLCVSSGTYSSITVFQFICLIQRFHTALSFPSQEVGACQLHTSSYPIITSHQEATVGFIFIPSSATSFRHHCLLPFSLHGNWYLPEKKGGERGTTRGMWGRNNKRNLQVSLDNSQLLNSFFKNNIAFSSWVCPHVENVSFPWKPMFHH